MSQCYGCGRLNPHGLQIKSYWEGEESVCRFRPRPYHTSMPGYVYGGLIASLIDCHATGTAAAAKYREEGREPGTPPAGPVRDRLPARRLPRPDPGRHELEVRARVKEIKGKKVVIEASLAADGKVCARGEVVTVQIPPGWPQARK